MPEIETIYDLVEYNSHQFGEKQALVFEGRQFSYSHLDHLSNSFRDHLNQMDIRRGDRGALILPNCAEFLHAFFGILKAGAAVVSCNPMFKELELMHILKDSRSKAAICVSFQDSPLRKIKADLPHLQRVIQISGGSSSEAASFQEFLREPKKSGQQVEVGPDDLAVLLYTAGTTGHPKGAMLTHKNFLASVSGVVKRLKFSPEDCSLAVIPLYHVYGMGCVMLTVFRSHSKMILLPRYEAEAVMKVLGEGGVTMFMGVPPMYVDLSSLAESKLQSLSPSLRACLSGAAPLPVEVIKRFEARFHTLIVEGYGLTEATGPTHVNPIDGLRKPGSIGVPYPGVESKVVGEDGTEVPTGVVGEIVVRGDIVMKGYWDNPQSTQEAIREGWLHTGDLAKRDEDGYYYVVERKKDMILTSGFNVYPREVEEMIFQHPKVGEVAVAGMPDERRGEVAKAFVVLKAGTACSEQEIIEWCQERMARYKVPREVEFVESLPKSLAGKVLRRVLREKVG